MFIAGEAGIGKSRLLLEFRRRLEAASNPITWLEGRCVSFGQGIPMLPLIDQLHETFGVTEGDGEPELIAKVEQGMKAIGRARGRNIIRALLLSADPGDAAVAAMDASARRKRLFDALRALMLRGAASAPGSGVRGPPFDRHQHSGVPGLRDGFGRGRARDVDPHASPGANPSLCGAKLSYHVEPSPPFRGPALEMATRVLGATDFPRGTQDRTRAEGRRGATVRRGDDQVARRPGISCA